MSELLITLLVEEIIDYTDLKLNYRELIKSLHVYDVTFVMLRKENR